VLTLSARAESRRGTRREPAAVLGFNLRDPILKDVRVRQAIAYALDCRPMIEYLWRGQAQPARSVLPPQSWAYNGDVPAYEHDPAKARAIARRRRLSRGERSALSHHHEDFDGRKHTPDGRRDAAAVARGRDRARHSQLRARHISSPT
jgi:hypothetical protein